MADELGNVEAEAALAFGGPVFVSGERISDFDAEEFRDKFRANIARLIIVMFLIGVLLILVAAPTYNIFVPPDVRLDMLGILTTYAGILGPFVGVISGYYFKN